MRTLSFQKVVTLQNNRCAPEEALLLQLYEERTQKGNNTEIDDATRRPRKMTRAMSPKKNSIRPN
jgi:hypothetical protein